MVWLGRFAGKNIFGGIAGNLGLVVTQRHLLLRVDVVGVEIGLGLVIVRILVVLVGLVVQ